MDTYELVQTRCILSSLGSTQEKEKEGLLQLLFASLAWVSVEQRDPDLQSTASMRHSISRRSFRKFYLIALEPLRQHSPTHLLMVDWRAFPLLSPGCSEGGALDPWSPPGHVANKTRREMEQLTIDGNDDGSLILQVEVEVVVVVLLMDLEKKLVCFGCGKC